MAVWFCLFVLNIARRLKLLFLAAKYQAYYIEHLKLTSQLSEALVQAHQLQIFSNQEFGEDYLDWLEDAPNALKLCKELDALKKFII